MAKIFSSPIAEPNLHGTVYTREDLPENTFVEVIRVQEGEYDVFCYIGGKRFNQIVR